MYRMGIMALISSDIPGVNRDKCIKMAIVHDIAEAIVGDITPYDGISKSEKLRREQEALDHMCKLLGGGSRAQEISELWMDYENNSSPEAKIVKDLDKVEMILQALEYENELLKSTTKRLTRQRGGKRNELVDSLDQDMETKKEQGKDLDEFFQSTAGKFQTELGRAWASEIVSRRSSVNDSATPKISEN
ncbi:uncharacterized protein LOC103493441 isoform X3 [Cucumis melo]|nr:uncharacterized protein LOC103493441 isoform X3 [Cucumis melo]XP_050940578.1 uncharacterized protein LOC103493441 isoform X3 [Cucumis melo]XP_050940579.1 uncharacterized protein LOC103493441 isoform X3 [Cucumis melo]